MFSIEEESKCTHPPTSTHTALQGHSESYNLLEKYVRTSLVRTGGTWSPDFSDMAARTQTAYANTDETITFLGVDSGVHTDSATETYTHTYLQTDISVLLCVVTRTVESTYVCHVYIPLYPLRT